ncbi:MAG: TIGR01459 family HAD-type hydrolase [Alphaproteobacteria bacterium]|nr:TIGR01459 family HAD-type hydrolase [Alphaproteobacteria bacterium]
MLHKVDRLADLNDRYDVIFCDVWGVLHNGVEARPFAGEALSAFRQQGGAVILITNSPRRRDAVAEQLDMIGVDPQAYDRIVTSGDVTRDLIAAGSNQIYFVGPDRDRSLFEGLGVVEVGLDDAGIVVCTGLYDDEHETADQYVSLLEDFKSRDLSFICANPDLVVERGARLIPCAGAIAALYEQMGGTTLISGKPHRPIYEAALELATAMKGKIGKDRILAIGDGMPTDVRGAQDFGLDLLYISDGIHTTQYTDGARVHDGRLESFLRQHGAAPVGWMQRLG